MTTPAIHPERTNLPDRPAASPGHLVELSVGEAAHGGHCVARHDGQVVFVRHAAPGERVRALVTEVGAGRRFLRADVVEVLEASPDRVEPPCQYAHPGGCGGCDWQHVSLPAQRRLKADVVRQALRGIGGLQGDLVDDVVVEPVPGADDGLGWRTRLQYAVTAQGRAGLRAHRSHDVVAIERCLIASPAVASVRAEMASWPAAARVEVLAADPDQRAVVITPSGPLPELMPDLPDDIDVVTADGGGRTTLQHGRGVLTHEIAGRRFMVHVPGFWQVHVGAPETLARAVLEALDPQLGEAALDLYGGAGLFAGVLAPVLGPGGRVTVVESDRGAVLDAVTNTADLPNVTVLRGEVAGVLAGRGGSPRLRRVELVVLDPPRAGAGPQVVHSIVRLRPRRVAYVACDPAALARDLRTFAEQGYVLTALRAFDLFPMTQHVECLATLAPVSREPVRQDGDPQVSRVRETVA